MTAEGVDLNAKILHNLKQLARQRRTGVEGVVLWLAMSYNPGQAMNELLK